MGQGVPCMPALADEGPDMVIQPLTNAAMARSVRSVLPLPARGKEAGRVSARCV